MVYPTYVLALSIVAQHDENNSNNSSSNLASQSLNTVPRRCTTKAITLKILPMNATMDVVNRNERHLWGGVAKAMTSFQSGASRPLNPSSEMQENSWFLKRQTQATNVQKKNRRNSPCVLDGHSITKPLKRRQEAFKQRWNGDSRYKQNKHTHYQAVSVPVCIYLVARLHCLILGAFHGLNKLLADILAY